jgi:hypothetical protein
MVDPSVELNEFQIQQELRLESHTHTHTHTRADAQTAPPRPLDSCVAAGIAPCEASCLTG